MSAAMACSSIGWPAAFAIVGAALAVAIIMRAMFKALAS